MFLIQFSEWLLLAGCGRSRQAVPDPLRSLAVLYGHVDDRLNPVLLRIENEGCIVAIAVFRSRSWGAVASPTVAQCSSMKFVYLIRLRGSKGQMKAFSGNHDFRHSFQAQLIVTTFIPVSHGFIVSKDLDVSQGF